MPGPQKDNTLLRGKGTWQQNVRIADIASSPWSPA
jgi:hypothetical protein